MATCKRGICQGGNGGARKLSRVTIERPNDGAAAGASGHIDLTNDANWALVGRFSANIITRGGRERWRFDQVQPEVTRILELDSSKSTRAISPRYRVKLSQDGVVKVFGVTAAFDRDNARETVEVHCLEEA